MPNSRPSTHLKPYTVRYCKSTANNNQWSGIYCFKMDCDKIAFATSFYHNWSNLQYNQTFRKYHSKQIFSNTLFIYIVHLIYCFQHHDINLSTGYNALVTKKLFNQDLNFCCCCNFCILTGSELINLSPACDGTRSNAVALCCWTR